MAARCALSGLLIAPIRSPAKRRASSGFLVQKQRLPAGCALLIAQRAQLAARCAYPRLPIAPIRSPAKRSASRGNSGFLVQKP
ncbi:hypothetical protein [Klebsiella variicola]|uniref:hypothetical protein n=1 Tax=Klebsiella variicola TaxID=244366 RepID=UPI0030D0DD24